MDRTAWGKVSVKLKGRLFRKRFKGDCYAKYHENGMLEIVTGQSGNHMAVACYNAGEWRNVQVKKD